MGDQNNKVPLRWTGHALIDMGVASIVLGVNKNKPEEVTKADWDTWFKCLEKDYVNYIFKKQCSILFTINAFDNPTWSKCSEERSKKIQATFEKVRNFTETNSESCTFFPELKGVVRAARDLFPLLMGRQQLNFYSYGVPDLPMSNVALGCVLSLPRVCPIVSGRAMVIGVDDPELLLDVCDYWKGSIDRELTILRMGNGESWMIRKKPRTRLMETLEEVFNPNNSFRFLKSNRKSGITLYHITNSGNEPTIDIHRVRPIVNAFLVRAERAGFKDQWNSLVNAFWLRPNLSSPKYENAIIEKNTKKTRQTTPLTENKRQQASNEVYDLLPQLPEMALKFIDKIFLKFVLNRVKLRKDFFAEDFNIWPLVELFVTEILPNMKKERIETIRRLADELADEINANRDKRLFKQLMGLISGSDNYGIFRTILIRAIRNRLKRTEELLLTLDDYVLLFEESEGFPHIDWRLVRDLVRIAVLEKLYSAGFFQTAPEFLEDEEDALQPESSKIN